MAIKREQKQTAGDSLGSQKFKLAILIFLVYIFFIVYMLIESGTKEIDWTRMLYLFSGLEAIVFAALGYVFGKDIHRIRAENAEEDAKQAKKETDKAKKESEIAKDKAQREREKGIELSSSIRSQFENSGKDNDVNFEAKKGAEAFVKGVAKDNYLLKLANNLYPEYSNSLISFDYDITPADKINSITINGVTEESASGTFSKVQCVDNCFNVHVEKGVDFGNWTLKITRIIAADGSEKRQVGGKLVSSEDTDVVELENV